MPPPKNIWERTVRFQEKQASKLREEKKRLVSRERSNCTFRPDLSLTRKQNRSASSSVHRMIYSSAVSAAESMVVTRAVPSLKSSIISLKKPSVQPQAGL